jgi:DNA-binding LacI/PurR family transcriptional regulator
MLQVWVAIMSKKQNVVTINDIAQKAGVSTATVCRILNNHKNVAEDVALRVNKVIEESGYTPKPRQKRMGVMPYVAVLTDMPIGSFESDVLFAIQDRAIELGLIAGIYQMPKSTQKQAEIYRQLKQHRLEGIIFVGFYLKPEEWIKLQSDMNVPMAILNDSITYPNIACVNVNFERAITHAIGHLYDLGHTRIAYIGDYANQFSKMELHGVETELSQRGLNYPEEYYISVSHSSEGASQAINRIMILPADKRPTAIIAFDDEFAIHIMNALWYYKLRIPEDISLIGFDNIHMSYSTFPPLTTVDIPKHRIGRQLLELIVQLRENKEQPIGNIVVNGSLIVRNSTGPAPKK